MRKLFVILLILCSPLSVFGQDYDQDGSIYEAMPSNGFLELYHLQERVETAAAGLMTEVEAWAWEIEEQRQQHGASGSWDDTWAERIDIDYRCNLWVAATAQLVANWSLRLNIYADAISTYCIAAEIPGAVLGFMAELQATTRHQQMAEYWTGYYQYWRPDGKWPDGNIYGWRAGYGWYFLAYGWF